MLALAVQAITVGTTRRRRSVLTRKVLMLEQREEQNNCGSSTFCLGLVLSLHYPGSGYLEDTEKALVYNYYLCAL